MFSLLPNTSSPVVNWIASHGPLVILSTVALIAFATMVRFAQPSADGGYEDWFADGDSSDDGGGGHD